MPHLQEVRPSPGYKRGVGELRELPISRAYEFAIATTMNRYGDVTSIFGAHFDNIDDIGLPFGKIVKKLFVVTLRIPRTIPGCTPCIGFRHESTNICPFPRSYGISYKMLRRVFRSTSFHITRRLT